MKKSAFLTFIFACWPGAGQMYLGYTKRGFSLMTIFLLLIGLSGFLDLWIFAVLTPVIWFFAFFDAWAIRNRGVQPSYPDDDFLFFSAPDSRQDVLQFARKYHRALGIGLILLGLYVIYNNLLTPALASLIGQFSVELGWLWRLANNLPALVLSMIFILFGLHLCRGERRSDRESGEEEDL